MNLQMQLKVTTKRVIMMMILMDALKKTTRQMRTIVNQAVHSTIANRDKDPCTNMMNMSRKTYPVIAMKTLSSLEWVGLCPIHHSPPSFCHNVRNVESVIHTWKKQSTEIARVACTPTS